MNAAQIRRVRRSLKGLTGNPIPRDYSSLVLLALAENGVTTQKLWKDIPSFAVGYRYCFDVLTRGNKSKERFRVRAMAMSVHRDIAGGAVVVALYLDRCEQFEQYDTRWATAIFTPQRRTMMVTDELCEIELAEQPEAQGLINGGQLNARPR